MNWEDILKAKSRAKGGGSKPDRRKVERLKRKGKLDELGQDIKARKHGKEAEGWEQQLHDEEPLDWDEPTDEEYDKWMAKDKPTGTYTLLDLPENEEGRKILVNESAEVAKKIVDLAVSRGYKEITWEDNRTPRAGFNEDLLVSSYGFDVKSDIYFLQKEMEYDVRRSTSVKRGITPAKKEVSTEKIKGPKRKPKRKLKHSNMPPDVQAAMEHQQKLMGIKPHDPDPDDTNTIQLFLAFQIHPISEGNGWKYEINLFKYSTAFDRDLIQSHKYAQLTSNEQQRHRQGRNVPLNLTERNLKNAGKEKHFRVDMDVNANKTVIDNIKSFFSYYLRL